MKIQIFEQFHEGHYTNYIQHLLPTLSELLSKKLIDKVVVTITPTHALSKAFQQQLSDHSNLIEFDTSLLEVNHDLTLNPKTILKEPAQARLAIDRRLTILSNLAHSVSRIQPDYLIATTADTLSLILSLQNFLGIQKLPNNLHSIGIMHYGCSGCVTNWNDRVKDNVYQFTWKHSPWSRLLMVNPLIYEAIKEQNRSLAKRVSLLPDPVPSSQSLDQKTARHLLGIPVDGRYLGFVGAMDHRKAIPELVAAFKDATSNPTDRLLLAGKLLPVYRQFIHQNHQDLLEAGRVILIDRYLNNQELTAGFCALDAATILHYKLPTLSANLLKSIAFHKPVIADNFGYPGFIVRRFQVGWSCEIAQHDSIVAALRKGLEHCQSYQITEQVSRLIQFHNPENYANTVLKDLRTLVGDPVSPKNWEWVLDADCPSLP